MILQIVGHVVISWQILLFYNMLMWVNFEFVDEWVLVLEWERLGCIEIFCTLLTRKCNEFLSWILDNKLHSLLIGPVDLLLTWRLSPVLLVALLELPLLAIRLLDLLLRDCLECREILHCSHWVSSIFCLLLLSLFPDDIILLSYKPIELFGHLLKDLTYFLYIILGYT